MVPAFPALWSERDKVAAHRRRYRRSDLVELLETAGFAVAETAYYQFCLRVEPFLHRAGVIDVEEAVPVSGLDATPTRNLDLQGERAVRDGVTAKQLVPRRVAHQQARNRAVAEVEHEASTFVRVAEQVRLAARGHDQNGAQFVLCSEQIARDPERHRRPVRHVVELERQCVDATQPVRDEG